MRLDQSQWKPGAPREVYYCYPVQTGPSEKGHSTGDTRGVRPMGAPTTPYPTIYTDRLITADELAAMPEHARYELVLGRLVPVAPASTDHGDIGSNLTYLVMHHVRTHKLG